MKRLALLVLSFPLIVSAAPAQPAVATALDTLIAARFKPALPGVAALVLRDGKVPVSYTHLTLPTKA